MAQWFHIPPGDPYYCVIGSPISHSKSPEIHRAFARQCGIALRYERVEVTAADFSNAIKEFITAGGRGMNVTVPLKEHAFRIASHRRPNVELAGASNTLTIGDDGSVIADNTDGSGLVRDLTINHRLSLEGCKVLLIGAGGAARGVIPSLLGERLGDLVVVNRTFSKATELAKRFSSIGRIQAVDYATLPDHSYDLIINATSLSLSGEIPPLESSIIDSATHCYDMMYSADGRTSFLDWCVANGAGGCSDGLGMLVEQAAAAFASWHGAEPDTAPVIAGLR